MRRDPQTTHPSIPSKKDWGEDFPHENGNYECRCAYCGHSFIGHKRRVVCRECNPPKPEDAYV